MSGFIVVAGLLTLAAVGVLLYPLLRRAGDSPAAWRPAAIAGVALVAGGAALYPVWSNFDWSEPAPALDSPAAMVGRLARRLEKQPDDLQGWLLLGRSYSVIEQFPLAARAYQRADSLAKHQNPDALIGLAESLVNAGRSDLAGRAGRLFEQALELDPNSVKALFYSAVAATERNELPLARSRFMRLLDGNPPEQVRTVIEEQVRALDGMMLLAGTAPGAAAPAAAAAQARVAPPSQQGSASPAAAATASVSLRVTLAAGVAGSAAPGAPLFVLARVPGQRGPPLAAKRLEARFPQDVELSASDAMMGGSGFAAGQQIELEARIANGGSAISRSGDPFGTVTLTVGAGGRAAIEINRLKP